MSKESSSPKISFLNRMKISNKLTLVYSGMVVFILIILTSSAIFSVYVYGNYQSERVLAIAATTIMNGITEKEHLFENDWDDITMGNDLYVVVFSESGEILRKPDSLDADDELIEDGNIVTFGKVFRRAFFDDAAYINKSVMLSGEVYIVQIIMDYRTELRMLIFMSITLFVLLFLGAAGSIIVGRKMSIQMLRPIGDMIEDANKIQLDGAEQKRLNLPNKRDEITDLGNTINAMLDRIESYSRAQIQFVSDASHELRTPITVVLSYAEMLKKWAKDDKEALEKSINNIEKEALDMMILVERLLMLAKSDTNNLPIAPKPFQLSELIAELNDETRLLAGEREVHLSENAALVLDSDRHCLKELLRIILDNAIKYTKEDGRIELSSAIIDVPPSQSANLKESVRLTDRTTENAVKPAKKALKIEISDNGIGIKKADLEKIFDRFYCAETSRNKKKSGNGLGLAIAKALATQLGFKIEADSKENEYTKFTLIKLL